MIALALLLTVAAPADLRVEVQGQVREAKVGPTTQAVLLADDKQYRLRTYDPGVREELLRLSGAVIKVVALKQEASLPPGNELLVQRYEIVQVADGEVPQLGTLARMADTGVLLFVDDQGVARRLPESWNRKMARLVGARMWVVGEAQDGLLQPTRFKVLRSPRNDGGDEKGSNR